MNESAQFDVFAVSKMLIVVLFALLSSVHGQPGFLSDEIPLTVITADPVDILSEKNYLQHLSFDLKVFLFTTSASKRII